MAKEKPITSIQLSTTEKRQFRRRSLYIADAAKVEITTLQGMAPGYIVDVDPRGIGVAIADEGLWGKFASGDAIEVLIESPTTAKSIPLPGRICHLTELVSEGRKFLRVGIDILPNSVTELARRRMSGFHSYKCPTFFRPLAFCQSPFFLGETIHFQVTEARSNGLVAATSFRNQGIYPGMNLPLTLMLPNLGEYAADIRIIEVTQTPDAEYTEVVMSFIDAAPELLAAIGEFILSFAKDVTLKTLHEQGFFLDTIYRAIRISYPSRHEDWDAIRELRFRAYRSVGKFMDKDSPKDMLDPFDRYARQIIATVGDNVVGAARIVFVASDLARSEHQALGIPIPDFLRDGGFVEFSRFCTDPAFRGGDLFIALMRQATLIVLNSKIKYIVANCNSDLWQVYKNLGFKTAGAEFEAFGRKDCRLIYCDARQTILKGKDSGIVHWNQTVFPVTRFAALENRKTLLRFHPWIAVQRMVDPLIARIRLSKNHERFRRRQNRKNG